MMLLMIKEGSVATAEVQRGNEGGEGNTSGGRKMGAFDSHTVGLQITYRFDKLSNSPSTRWLRGSWIQATYDHVFVDRDEYRFGNARIGSLALSLPF